MTKDKFDKHTLDWYDEVMKRSQDELDDFQGVTKEMIESKKRQARIQAFLDIIGYTEGTTRIKGSDNGYNVIVGGDLFHDYSDHPRVLVDLPNLGIKSSAAGKFQILSRYWDHYSKQLGLKDFSPKNQDRYALNMFREVGALEDIEEGRIEEAIKKCASRWASFPDAGYNQREESMVECLEKYNEFYQEQLKRV